MDKNKIIKQIEYLEDLLLEDAEGYKYEIRKGLKELVLLIEPPPPPVKKEKKCIGYVGDCAHGCQAVCVAEYN